MDRFRKITLVPNDSGPFLAITREPGTDLTWIDMRLQSVGSFLKLCPPRLACIRSAGTARMGQSSASADLKGSGLGPTV